MRNRKRGKFVGKIFDSIRKPTPPPSQKFGDERPEAKIHPANRKTKHKKREVSDQLSDDV